MSFPSISNYTHTRARVFFVFFLVFVCVCVCVEYDGTDKGPYALNGGLLCNEGVDLERQESYEDRLEQEAFDKRLPML